MLISNIVTMSCAVAYTLCDDCPKHEPVLCLDSCPTAEAAISDSAPTIISETFRPALLANSPSSIDLEFKLDRLPLPDEQPPDPRTSPPLHLQFCVFLK
ncbi:MAG: hypothetical protein CL797_06140 [Chromatiales bacterium]|nr:hypothetical protein [Chromatiales bacterium]